MSIRGDHLKFRQRLICSKCGKKINDYGYRGAQYQLMKGCNLCFECSTWQQLADNRPDDLQIILGVAYHVLPYVPKNDRAAQTLGGDGKDKFIFTKDGTTIKSNDIWKIGVIPWYFQDILPDTAYFVPENIYRKLNNEYFTCTCQGCYDRYHCLRYDYRVEFENGPFNCVPKDWIVGEERCSSFINMCKIPGYDKYYNINDLLNYEIQDSKTD